MGLSQSHTPTEGGPQAPGAFPATSSASTSSTAMSTQPATAQSPVRSLFPPKFLLAVADLVYGSTAPDVYVPKLADIAAAYEVLQEHQLPPELIPSILDRAEYWFVSRVTLKREVAVAAGTRTPRQMVGAVVRWRSGQEDDLIDEMEVENSGLSDAEGKMWYLVTEPIGATQAHAAEDAEAVDEKAAEQDERVVRQDQGRQHKPKAWLKRIIVDTKSKDQGWSSGNNEQLYGTYERSYTWFELSLLRDGREVEGSRMDLQHNVHAGQYYKDHTNTLEQDHKLVRMAQSGDRVVLWIRAQYPGRINHTREATVTLFESPFPPQH